jgi:pimeloyl-ACP methyl ester carboxylesterase
MEPLAHAEAGTGAPVVLLHAFPLSRAMWQADAARLASMARVVLPDLPGFGGSPRLAHPSITGMAAALAALLDVLKIQEPVILGGLSMGGYVALEFIRQCPGRVKALGLFSTRASADSPQQREGRMALIGQLEAAGVGLLMTSSVPKLVGRTTQATRPAVLAHIERLVRAASREGVSDALRAMAERPDARTLLAGIRCPVLVIAGDEDALIPAQESRAMAQAIPGAKLEIIPQAGHLVNLEQPEMFQRLIEAWIRGR